MSLLVVQGHPLAETALAELSALAGATAERTGPAAVRITGVARSDAVVAWCCERRLDFAYLDRPRRLGEYRVLAMDMDSTLIAIECIDEIADFAGVKPRVAAVTEAAMRGELDFPTALRQRVALLEGLPETVLQRVYDERLRLSPGAEALLAAARTAGLQTLLVSGGFTYFTVRLAERLGLHHTLANRLEIHGGCLTGRVLGDIVDAQAKAEKLAAVCRALGCPTSDALALGDGANDLKMMSLAGFSVAFRAKPVVQKQASAGINTGGLDRLLDWIPS
jgi:phosphoserine phosphatase